MKTIRYKAIACLLSLIFSVFLYGNPAGAECECGDPPPPPPPPGCQCGTPTADLLYINAVSGETYDVALTVGELRDSINSGIYKLSYDSAKLELINLPYQNIISQSSGAVIFSFDIYLGGYDDYNGVIAVARFKAIQSGTAVVKCEQN